MILRLVRGAMPATLILLAAGCSDSGASPAGSVPKHSGAQDAAENQDNAANGDSGDPAEALGSNPAEDAPRVTSTSTGAGGASSSSPSPIPPSGVSNAVGGAAGAASAGEVAGAAPPGDVAADSGDFSADGDIVADAPPVVVNPFVDVAHDPMSTFAVDVDTASYDIFRRDVNNGHLPEPSSVRVEEFVNFFAYDYPAPEAGADEPFSISLAAGPGLFTEHETTTLRVGIQGEVPPEFEKKPANLVFLVDVSGSMQSAVKLPLVQQVLSHTVDILEPQDTVALVTYASGTQVVLEPTPASDAETILGAIDGLKAGGSTNGAGGIQLAYEQARDGFLEGGINHVILCTDGDFNVGVSSTQGLVALIEEERKGGVTLTALGFGERNNDSMMELVSNAGNGVYGVIANEDQATEYVENRLLHNLTFIAKDVKIQVEFNPEYVSAYRLLGYENRAIADQDFRNDQVDAGEIGAGHRVTALYELVLVGGEVPSGEGLAEYETGATFSGESEAGPEDLVLVKVRYKDVDAGADDPAYEVRRALVPDDVATDLKDLDEDFQWAGAVAAFAESLRGSPFVSSSDLDAAEALITEQAARDTERREFATLFSVAREMSSGN